MESPLQKRAWVLQESLLAKRTLHFTSRQIYFGCKEHVVAEIFALNTFSVHSLGRGLLQDGAQTEQGPGTIDTSKPFRSSTSPSSITSRKASTSTLNHTLTRAEALHRWHEIIEIYTSLNLTFETDRQVAIGGIVRCLQPALSCKHVADLWDYRLELQLLWYCLGSWTRTSVSKAPSWSWVSSPGEVRYRLDVYNIDDLRYDLFKVLSIEAESSEGDEVRVVDGRLQVGKLTPVTLTKTSELSESEEGDASRFDHQVKIRKKSFEFIPDIDYPPGKYYSTTLKYHVQGNRYCTFVSGLVWKPTGRRRGEFRRVGCFNGHYDELLTVKELDDLDAYLCGRGDASEKTQMTEEL